MTPPDDGRAANDTAPDPDVEAALAELLPQVIPLLRGALARVKRSGGRRNAAVVLREAPGDRDRADELSRARARELLDRHAKRGGR